MLSYIYSTRSLEDLMILLFHSTSTNGRQLWKYLPFEIEPNVASLFFDKEKYVLYNMKRDGCQRSILQ